MDLTNKSVIKNLLEKHNAKPEKYLGQHFILSKNALSKMIEMSQIKKDDIIIEIGPGLGTLTRELVRTSAKIIAIEKDPLMISILKETLADYKNVKIVHADARRLFGEKPGINLGKTGYKIVANLPYNIATFLIRSWLGLKTPPKLMVLMVQKEVAQRMAAKPPQMNLLGVSVQFYADAEIVSYVPKEMFWPRPKVDSAIIKIVPKKQPQKTQKAFFAVVKAGFSHPRKQLISNLVNKLGIRREYLVEIFRTLRISEKVRPENLNLDQWLKLASKLVL